MTQELDCNQCIHWRRQKFSSLIHQELFELLIYESSNRTLFTALRSKICYTWRSTPNRRESVGPMEWILLFGNISDYFIPN